MFFWSQFFSLIVFSFNHHPTYQDLHCWIRHFWQRIQSSKLFLAFLLRHHHHLLFHFYQFFMACLVVLLLVSLQMIFFKVFKDADLDFYLHISCILINVNDLHVLHFTVPLLSYLFFYVCNYCCLFVVVVLDFYCSKAFCYNGLFLFLRLSYFRLVVLQELVPIHLLLCEYDAFFLTQVHVIEFLNLCGDEHVHVFLL